MNAGLSKNRVMDGAQCVKLLWLRVHEPDAPELIPGARTQALFDAGREVGELARREFSDGMLVELRHRDPGPAIAETRRLVERGTVPIFEAAAAADGVFAAVDVLEPSPAGWLLNEVKATTKVKEHHPLDLAVQVHVLRAAGIDVVGARLVHLNRECRYPDLSNLFVIEDVTAAVEAELPRVPRLIEQLVKVVEGDEPEVEPGPHCRRPYSCAFTERCAGRLPKHHIGSLYRLHPTKRDRLERGRIATIPEIPVAFKLTETQARQRRAIVEDRLVIEPGLRAALEHGIEGPASFLDFETISMPVPRWQGSRPWQQIPVQFSVHRELAVGSLDHIGYLAEAGGDPRPELARALVKAIPREGPVYVYYEPFEGYRLRELADAMPEFAEALLAIDRRLVDLLPIVCNHIYHPGFGGSFSIKSVVPVLCPGDGWDGLDVASGHVAAAELQALLLAPEAIGEKERARKREALVAYCERDTHAMVALLRELKALAQPR